MDFEVYCDESGQELFGKGESGEHFVLIGSLWVRAENRLAYKEYIKQLRREHKVGGEFKWKRVSPSRVNFFLDLVRFFFEQGDEMRFRVIVLRADEMDAVRFHESDNELMFYKFYYQVLHHWILDFNRYRVFVDTKTNRLHSRIQTLEKCLRHANLSSLVQVQALPSHEVDLLQLVDVLTEAVRGSGTKDRFDLVRAEHMDWISAVLCDGTAELYRRFMPNRKLRRIALVSSEDYAVVTEVERNERRAQFVTAYVVNSAVALGKMRNNPRWR